MRNCLIIIAVSVLIVSCGGNNVVLDRSYEELPLGAVKPEGWLLETLLRQRDGITAELDKTYPSVLGDDNGWLGGEGDRWERGPYWIDGLLPLAYILDDQALKDKAQRWVEWALASVREDGFFGPDKGYPYVEGLQRGLPLDWWPRIVMLKVLRQYYDATGDGRVLDLFDAYFHYQLEQLPDNPLDKWSFWARYRAGDNLDVVLWYYSLTGEPYLLELAQLLHGQSFDFTSEFLKGDLLRTPGSIHCVNLAQGLKEPVVYWQFAKDRKYLDAVFKAMDDLRRFNGFANGMFGGDEALHGNDPRQGSELCSAVELMFSYERMLQISGDTRFADALEKVAFNAFPAQVSDDFSLHQYFQKPNQAQVTFGLHNFDVGQKGTGQVFGFLTAYPCCLTNMHQGWPKFTRNLWYSTPDGGFAAMVYAPCVMSSRKDETDVRIEEITDYPFGGDIQFRVGVSSPVSFPLELRIPSWAAGATLTLNGENLDVRGDKMRIERNWNDGDLLHLHLDMDIAVSRWFQNSVAIERGPLVYALGLDEEWRRCEMTGDMRREFGECYYEVLAGSPWNYGLLKKQLIDNPGEITVCTDSARLRSKWPWSLDAAPVSIRLKAVRIPEWQLYDGDCGPLPWSLGAGGDVNDISGWSDSPQEEITLVPYGCTTLRICEFPLVTR